MTEFSLFIKYPHIGEIASVLGLLVGIVGFIITVKNVRASRRAAENAEKISDKVRNDLIKSDTVAHFSIAISAMDEIKRLAREKAWEILPDRCSGLRKSLVSIKASNPQLENLSKKRLQSAIQNFASLEDQFEKSMAAGSDPADVPQINKLISHQIDSLQELLVQIKNRIGKD